MNITKTRASDISFTVANRYRNQIISIRESGRTPAEFDKDICESILEDISIYNRYPWFDFEILSDSQLDKIFKYARHHLKYTMNIIK